MAFLGIGVAVSDIILPSGLPPQCLFPCYIGLKTFCPSKTLFSLEIKNERGKDGLTQSFLSFCYTVLIVVGSMFLDGVSHLVFFMLKMVTLLLDLLGDFEK